MFFASFFSESSNHFLQLFIGLAVISLTCALLGSTVVLQRRVLAYEAVAHALFPGICLSFALTGSTSPIVFSIGGGIAGALALFCIDYIPRKSKLSKDSAIGLVLSVSFGLGIWLLRELQRSKNNPNVLLLKSYLTTKDASSILAGDLYVILLICVVVLLLFFVLRPYIVLLTFDPEAFEIWGYPLVSWQLFYNGLLITTMVVGVHAVGVVLVPALLTIAACTARFMARSYRGYLGYATVLSLGSVVATALFTGYATRFPTGPALILFLVCISLLVFIWMPGQGLLHRLYARQAYKKKIDEDHLLKLFYGQQEQGERLLTLKKIRQLPDAKLVERLGQTLKRLIRRRDVVAAGKETYALSLEGTKRAKKILYKHQLWERYLGHMHQKEPEAFHQEAEIVEHILTQPLEKEIEALLQQNDPQN